MYIGTFRCSWSQRHRSNWTRCAVWSGPEGPLPSLVEVEDALQVTVRVVDPPRQDRRERPAGEPAQALEEFRGQLLRAELLAQFPVVDPTADLVGRDDELVLPRHDAPAGDRYPSGKVIFARIASRSLRGTPAALSASATHGRLWLYSIVCPQLGQEQVPWMSRRSPSRFAEESRRANRSTSTAAPLDDSRLESGTRTGVLQMGQRANVRQVHPMRNLATPIR
jgi:hypothetical protein